MKKVLLISAGALLLLGGLAGGTAWLLKRPAHAAPPDDEGAQSVSVKPEGAGVLLEIQDGGLPLRSLRWIGPLPGGVAVAQIATQSDRQQVAVVKSGRPQGLFLVPRPAGIGEGLFNHAELMDACLTGDDALVLLYKPLGGGEGEPALVLALDLPARTLRWCHRAPGERLAAGGVGKDAAVFLYGKVAPIQRLPIALQKGETEGISPVRTALKPYEKPEELGDLEDLLPTGSWTFLVAHTRGLSAFNGTTKGWNHLAGPPPNRLGFTAPRGALAQTGKRYWWQPEPGGIMPVQADGTPIADAEAPVIAIPEPPLDAQTLKLLGGDEEGRLWFALATPSLRAVAPPPRAQIPGADGEAAAPPAAEIPEFTSGELLAWEQHLRSDLGRIYIFDPVTKKVQRFAWLEAWPSLKAPEGFTRPGRDGGLQPSAGGALLTSDRGAWWVPLKNLPLQPMGAPPVPAAGK
ncbi:MAG: hypothetical protein IPL96_14495 [Holophagaceae bacterium]|nr:hypothetical protein [Holophagaceae bacterium]